MRKGFWWLIAGTALAALGVAGIAHIPGRIVLIDGGSSAQGMIRQQFDRIAQLVLPSAESNARPFDMLFAGDILLGRFVETLMDRFDDGYAFAHISSTLQGYDAVVGNLEGPIVTDHEPTPYTSMTFSMASSVAALLRENHFTHLSLANNHTDNQGTAGIRETRMYLQGADLTPFGEPYRTAEDGVAYLAIGGHTVALVGVNATGLEKPATEAKELVGRLRAANAGSFIVVFAHWGDEYQNEASDTQQELAHALVDSGANLIIGSHPHVIQNIEAYHGAPIFYSLGNFIFDQYFSKETQEGLLVRASFDGDAVTYELLPVVSKESQPALAAGAERLAMLTALAARSDEGLRAAIRRGVIRPENIAPVPEQAPPLP
jgi:poly-gamma-glutamate capsule biosynthesis protein CapA/YwtB (metallophosphatase superfamily)